MFAAIRNKIRRRSNLRRSKPGGSLSQRSRRLSCEALEERSLLTAQPIIFATLSEGVHDFGNTTAAAQVAQLAPMMETDVQGKLGSGADVDMFKISLQPGQIFVADVDRAGPTFGSTAAPRLSLLNSSGAVASGVSTSRSSQSIEFRAPQGSSASTYYVKLTDSVPSSSQSLAYNLHLRPISLDGGTTDPNNLSKTGGGLYAFLDGKSRTDGTKVLDISGPVGHGFGIRGNWIETVSIANGLTGATYKANGTVYLETPKGEVAMALPAGGIALSTKPQLWGDKFGEIGSLDWSAPANMAAYEAILGVVFPMGLLDLTAIQQGTKIGIGLGSDTAVQNTGAPVNAAVPYLYFTANPLMNSSIGSATQLFSIVADPGDPFLYIGSPLTADYFPITGLAASAQGLIPFTPNTAPSQFHGTLRGHVYVAGTIDTSALTEVPSEIEGDLVLNVDPAHTGKIFGGAAFTTADLVMAVTLPLVGPWATLVSNPDAAHTMFTNMSIGVNGALNISPFDKFKDGMPDAVNRFGQRSSLVQYLLDREVPRIMTVGQASLIYDGPTESAYFSGGTNNPFDGTPLASLAPTSVELDAAIKPGGAFYLDVNGGYKPLGLNATGEVLIENNWPTTVTHISHDSLGHITLTMETVRVSRIMADAQVDVLGVANAHLHGQVWGNGDFDLTGSVGVHWADWWGYVDGSANLDLNYSHTAGFSFTSHLGALYQDPTKSVVRANLDVYFSLGVNNSGQLTYAKDGRVGFSSTASVDVYAPKDGYQVWDWEWQNIGTVGVGVSNTEMWFYANGKRYSARLPH